MRRKKKKGKEKKKGQENKKRKRRSERVAEDQRDAEAFMHKVVASCIAMRGEVDAIAARLEKFRKVVSAAEEQLKNDKQCIRTDALRSPQRQRLVFLMRVQMSTASYLVRCCRAPC